MPDTDPTLPDEPNHRLTPTREALREITRRASRYRPKSQTPDRQAIRADILGTLLEIQDALDAEVPLPHIARIVSRMLGHDHEAVRQIIGRELRKSDTPMQLAREKTGGGEKESPTPAIQSAIYQPQPATPARSIEVSPHQSTGNKPRNPRITLNTVKPPKLPAEKIEELDQTGEVRAAIAKNRNLEPDDIGWLSDYRSPGKTGVSDAASKCMWIMRRKMEANSNRF